MNKLNLPTFSSEEEVEHEWLKNINILYNIETLNHLSNSEELKYYNRLYQYKLKLANKNIMVHLSADDLVELNKMNDSVIHLKLISYTPKLKKARLVSRSEPSLRKSSRRSKTEDGNDKAKTIHLIMNNHPYSIEYQLTKATFNLFKMEKNQCYGLLDEQAKLGSSAVHYESKLIDNIEIFFTTPLFTYPLYINCECNITIEQLMNNFPKNIIL